MHRCPFVIPPNYSFGYYDAYANAFVGPSDADIKCFLGETFLEKAYITALYLSDSIIDIVESVHFKGMTETGVRYCERTCNWPFDVITPDSKLSELLEKSRDPVPPIAKEYEMFGEIVADKRRFPLRRISYHDPWRLHLEVHPKPWYRNGSTVLAECWQASTPDAAIFLKNAVAERNALLGEQI